MKKNDIPYGVGVLVAKDGKFLCGLRKDTGEICGPGGHLEKDESPELAAVRETREEFGITPKKLQCLGCLQSKTKAYLPTMVFLCTDFDGEPKTDSEEMVAPYYGFNDIADLERKDAKLYPAFEDSLTLLEDCINGRSDGGPGSGNWGHVGRPGIRGGSGSGGGSSFGGGSDKSTTGTKTSTKVKSISDLKNGDSITFKGTHAIDKTEFKAKITETADDHVIATTDDGTKLWIDNDVLEGEVSVSKQSNENAVSNNSDLGNAGKRHLKSGYGKTEASDIINEKKDNSGKKYVDGEGNLSKERDALHTKIMDDVFFDNNDSNTKDRPLGKDGKPIGAATPVEGQARLVFMGGGPASGKSSVIASGDVDVPDNRVQIDPDRAKKALPEYQKMVAAGDIENAAGFAHEESSALAKRAYEKAAENNMNVCYDGTGDGSVKSVEKKLAIARANGMKVEGVYVTCSTEEAIKRSDVRAAKTGRKVNHDTIRDTHRKVSQILPQVADKFDTVSLYDTGQGGKPVLIATGGNGKGLTAVKGQEKLFQAFLDKANE